MRQVIRTRTTWLMYAANGVSAFFVYAVGPATPLIAEDLGISAQSAALHGTAMAAALLLAGAIATPMIRRWGRRSALVLAQLAMALGVGVVVVAPTLAVSLLGALVAGCGGAVSAIVANATLADSHPGTAPTVLSEANATAAWVGLFAPLLMGVFLAAGFGWRVGLAVAVPMCLLMAWGVGRRHRTRSGPGAGSSGGSGDPVPSGPVPSGPVPSGPVPSGPVPSDPVPSDPVPGRVAAEAAAEEEALASHDQRGGAVGVEPIGPVTTPGGTDPQQRRTEPVAPTGARVPSAVWVVMVAVMAAAGAEFAVNYWGSALLLDNTGASAGTRTAAMSAPVVGIAVGRTIGARVALRVPAHRLMVAGWLLSLVGFLTFWRVSEILFASAGLFLTGLGLAMLYPLLLDRAVLLMPDRSDRAMALAMPSVGLAIGLAPFGLGALAGQVGVSGAFLVVPLIMLVGLGAVLLSRPAPRGDR